MTIQEILGAYLSAHGQHELARQALESANRTDWVHLGDEAIRSAPEAEKTNVAFTVKLALDDPANDGPNQARDYVMVAEPHKRQEGQTMYRAYLVLDEELGRIEDIGLAAPDSEVLKRRVVAAHIVRSIKVLLP